MRNRVPFLILMTLACFALLWTGSTKARAIQATQPANNADLSNEQNVAEQMVPAQAVLDSNIDARKMQPGQQFRATLSGTVHLKDGIELPHGTTLVGTIATDSVKTGGGSTLALRFTQAEPKGGKAIPIEAIIVGVAPPEYSDTWDNSDGQAPPNPWNGKTLQIDQIGVLSGVDLHSRIGGNASGIFVATKKNDMKLTAKSQISLAIGAQPAAGMNSGY